MRNKVTILTEDNASYKMILCRVLTKTRNNLKRPTTTYNEQETTWNDLQRHNEQETTWNDLQRARNDLKRPETTSMGKKQPETTYNEQETTWNDLKRARNDMKRPTRTWKDLQRSKNDLETTYNEQEATWNNPQQERQPIMTWTYLQRAKKTRNERQQADF